MSLSRRGEDEEDMPTARLMDAVKLFFGFFLSSGAVGRAARKMIKLDEEIGVEYSMGQGKKDGEGNGVE